MPRLSGIREYRFVQPFVDAEGHANWRHPKGWRFDIINDQVAEDAHAERQEAWIRNCELQAKLCIELGHEHDVGGCRRKFDGEWKCQRWLRLAKECSRTAERTMLVRVYVPDEPEAA